jgi:hypothetical protein
MSLYFKQDKCSGTSGSFGVPAEMEEQRPPFDVAGLDAYALERWEVCCNSAVKCV